MSLKLEEAVKKIKSLEDFVASKENEIKAMQELLDQHGEKYN